MTTGMIIGLAVIGWIAIQGMWEVINGEIGTPIPELGQ